MEEERAKGLTLLRENAAFVDGKRWFAVPTPWYAQWLTWVGVAFGGSDAAVSDLCRSLRRGRQCPRAGRVRSVAIDLSIYSLPRGGNMMHPSHRIGPPPKV